MRLRDVGEALGRWLFPKAFEDQKRYKRLVNNLQKVRVSCGYEFPSAEVIVDWVMAPERDSFIIPKTADLVKWLEREHRGPEPLELAARIQECLEQERKHENSDFLRPQ